MTPAPSPPRLVCSGCGAPHPWSYLQTCGACGAILDVEYDLARARLGREGSPMRRYRELLPILHEDSIFDAGEGGTRCIHARELGAALGLRQLWLKLEGDNPTRSTKDRQAPVHVAVLRELGIRSLVTASTGNASSALARVVARFPKLELHVFVGGAFLDRLAGCDAPNVRVYCLPEGGFAEAGRAARDFAAREGLALDGGFQFWGKREGLKSVYYEAVEQVPAPIQYYVQSVSSGIGVYAVWRAARELRALGQSATLPRLVCVQEDSCDPMVRSWLRGAERFHPEDAVAEPRGVSLATLRGDPSGSYPALRRVVHASGGTLVSVGAESILALRERAVQCEGIELCPTSAMTVAAAAELRRRGVLAEDAVVLLNWTGAEREGGAPRVPDFRVTRDGEGWRMDSEREPFEATILAGVCEVVRGLVTLPAGEVLGAETVLLQRGLALDSISVLELLLALEKRFGRRIPSRDVTRENLETLGSVAALIARALAADRAGDA